MSSVKRIRLEQKPMPVSSQEELSLITLREQNKRLGNNYSHRMRIEADLKKRIEQLEEILKQCEDKEPENQLTILNDDLRNKVNELEFELNHSRLNEKRLSLDLEQLNQEFIQYRTQTKVSLANPAASSGTTSTDSIRNPSTLPASNFQYASGSNSNDSNQAPNNDRNYETSNNTNNNNFFAPTGTSTSPHPANLLNDQVATNQANITAELERKVSESVILAESRLKELESLQQQLKDAILKTDYLELQAKHIPKESIIESSEYKTLQSHFSVLYNEATQLKTQLVESKSVIVDMKNSHARQIERMSHEENRLMNELRTNMSDLEQSLTDARNQMGVFRLDYDSLCKAHEQTLKLDTELKKSLNSYKIQVQQKNNDLNRMKRLLDEARRERHHHDGSGSSGKHSSATANHTPDGENLRGDSNHSTHAQNPSTNQTPSLNQPNNNNSHSNTTKSSNISGSTSQNNSVNVPPPSNKKILELKEIIHQLQKQLDKTKSEEEALMQDLDVTGQAYEDMQEQNHRLLQQLEEKDDANLKLMSEHLKTNAFHKHLNEEKAQMEEYRDTLLKRIAAQENVVKSLEEKVSLLQENMNTLEKELEIRNNQNDSFKKEKLELGQELVELRLERDKLLGQMDDLRRSTKERISSLMDESSKNKRLIEKLESLEKKYERASKLQSATSPDEVLMEEIREYKEQLTCPSCKTKPKDAVLTKCFHVFCFDCLKTRVDTRQRKCPKCNAQFGANDFHRLYLA